MKKEQSPIPENEMERLISLSELDLDYSDPQENFKDLMILAAKVAGTKISLLNLIDSYTQWTVASHGLELKQIPREDSVCQYTIMSDQSLEIRDLSADERFNSKLYVQGPTGLRYYYGVPLQMSAGVSIGALCVLDSEFKTLTPEQVELLQIIAETVVKRLKSIEKIKELQDRLNDSTESKKKAAHDIRGPLAGIVGLSEIMLEQVSAGKTEEMLELIGMINKSGQSLLELTDDILTEDINQPLRENELNLLLLADKLEKLYAPQARHKDLLLSFNSETPYLSIPFPENKLIQIAGNLISNAIKFTPQGGEIKVNLSIAISGQEQVLRILVKDTGIGIDPAAMEKINLGKSDSTSGTIGEKGFGLGLSLVAHLVSTLNGRISLDAVPNQGSSFEVLLPLSLHQNK